MNKMMKILALVLALAMMTCFLAACGKDNQTDDNNANDKGAVTEPNTTEPQGTEPEGSEPSTTPDDGKKEYKITVTDSNGNPMSGVLVQICKEGSTCFTPTRTNDDGFAVWKLDAASDYYGTVSSLEEGMPKEFFGDAFEVVLVYNPPVAE